MKIYLVSRTDDWGYDDYDEMVVIAQTPTRAKNLTMAERSEVYNGWVQDVKNLKAREIGTTTRKPGIVLESFNAG